MVKFNPGALRRARNVAGLSMKDLADKSGVGFNTIFYLESGRSPNPRANTLIALGSALGVEWGIFFDGASRITESKKGEAAV